MYLNTHPSKTFNLENADKQDYPLSFERPKERYCIKNQ